MGSCLLLFWLQIGSEISVKTQPPDSPLSPWCHDSDAAPACVLMTRADLAGETLRTFLATESSHLTLASCQPVQSQPLLFTLLDLDIKLYTCTLV